MYMNHLAIVSNGTLTLYKMEGPSSLLSAVYVEDSHRILEGTSLTNK